MTNNERAEYTGQMKTKLEAEQVLEHGASMRQLMIDLFPLCRSITGNGLRSTLEILQSLIPLQIHEVPSGTSVLDWVIPQEWNVNDAYVRNSQGEKIIDFKKSNLHLLNYSVPARGFFSLSELKEHLYSLPESPAWIPYRTSYYTRNWGFCLSDDQLRSLPEDCYEVVVDTRLEDGHLSYGEYYLAGQSRDEVLISTHICHPSMANDNLSSLVISASLARALTGMKLRYSYRFLFLPGTIGSITWLSRNQKQIEWIRHGLVLACLGDAGSFTYKKSRRGDAAIDRIAASQLEHLPEAGKSVNFSPYGYDERQYCSPGFNLPLGCLMRTPHGEFPEYHTSADNLAFVTRENLQQSFALLYGVLRAIELNRNYLNLNPKGEPQLGRRGLFPQDGTQDQEEIGRMKMALLWLLNLSDGQHSLLDIAERSGLSMDKLFDAATLLVRNGLMRDLSCSAPSSLQFEHNTRESLC